MLIRCSCSSAPSRKIFQFSLGHCRRHSFPASITMIAISRPLLRLCGLHVPKPSESCQGFPIHVCSSSTWDLYSRWHSQSSSHYMIKLAMPVVAGRRPGSLIPYKEAYFPISVTLNCVFTNHVLQNGTAYTLSVSLHSFLELSWTYSQPLFR